MKSLNRNLTVISGLWILSLYLTLYEYHWLYLLFCIVGCPIWSDITNYINRKRIEHNFKDLIDETKQELKDKTRK